VGEEPAPEVVEESAPEVVEESAPEVVEETPMEEPAPEVVEETPVEESAPEVVEETPMEESAPEVVEESAPEVVEEPAPEVVEEPAPEVVEETPVEESTPEVVEETPMEESAPEVVEETPMEESTPVVVEETPMEEPTPEPVEETPMEEPAPEPVEETPMEESTPEPMEEPAPEVAEEPAPVPTPLPEEFPSEPVDEVPPPTESETTPDEAPTPEPTSDTPESTVETSEPAPTPEFESTPEPDFIPEPTPHPSAQEPTPEPPVTPTTPALVFIVPFRDREAQRQIFEQHMKSQILANIPPDYYQIVYVHQRDGRSFNRGAMKNIGFLTVKSRYPDTYRNITLVFNDVDTLPVDTTVIPDYTTTPGVVKHFFGVPQALGGIFSITAGDFEALNGFPNYWTWGYEDNFMYQRVVAANLNIDRSVFYPVGDTAHIHQGQNGVTRVINRVEFDRYVRKVPEGINTIQNLVAQPVPGTDFVDVFQYGTGFEHQPRYDAVYDISKGNQPYRVGYSSVRRSRMNMVAF